MSGAAPHAASHVRMAATLILFSLVGPPTGAFAFVVIYDLMAGLGLQWPTLLFFWGLMLSSIAPLFVWMLGLVPALITGAATLLVAVKRGRRAAVVASVVTGIATSMLLAPVIGGIMAAFPRVTFAFAAAGAIAALACTTLSLPLLPRRSARPSPPGTDP